MADNSFADFFSKPSDHNQMEFNFSPPANQDCYDGIDVQGRIDQLNVNVSQISIEQPDAKFPLCAQTQVGGTYAIGKTYEEAQESLSNLKSSSKCGVAEVNDENFSGARSDLVRTNVFENQGAFPDSLTYASVDENVMRKPSEGEVPYLLIENKDCEMHQLSWKPKMAKKPDSRVNDVSFTRPAEATQLSTSAGLLPMPESVIVKEIRKTQFNKCEAEALESNPLKNPGTAQSHVPELYAVGASDEFVMLVQEKVPGIELSSVIKDSREKPLTETALFHIAEATVTSLEALGKAEYVHLDVKPENAILRSNVDTDVQDYNFAHGVDMEKPMTMCYIDFGFAVGMRAKEFHTPTRAQLCGTPQYMSPQMVKNIKLFYDSGDKQLDATPTTVAQQCEENHESTRLCENLLNPSSAQRQISEDGHSFLPKHTSPSANHLSNGAFQNPSNEQSFCGETSNTHYPSTGGPQLCVGSTFAQQTQKKTPINKKKLRCNFDNMDAIFSNRNYCEESRKTCQYELDRSNDYQSAALMLYAVANGGSFFSIPNPNNEKSFRDLVEDRFNLEKVEGHELDSKKSKFMSKLDELSGDGGSAERFPKWFIQLVKAMYLGNVNRLKNILKEGENQLKAKVVKNTIDSHNMMNVQSRDENEAARIFEVDLNSLGTTLNPSRQFQLETSP